MQGFYENFVEKAPNRARRRRRRFDQVAQGRVWTGRQAREHGLVDALGGLDVAVRIAKERAHIPADQNVELVAYPTRRTLFQAISDQFGGGQMNIWSVLAGGAEQRAVRGVDRLRRVVPPRRAAGADAVRVCTHERSNRSSRSNARGTMMRCSAGRGGPYKVGRVVVRIVAHSRIRAAVVYTRRRQGVAFLEHRARFIPA
jgi:hypothetical protein